MSERTSDFDALTDIAASLYRRGWTPRLLLHALGRKYGRSVQVALRALIEGDRDRFDRAVEHDRRIVATLLSMTRDVPGGPATDATGHGTSAETRKVVERVRALLAKAESTTFEAEAEALMAKAQELMTRHAIEQAAVHGDRSECDIRIRHVLLEDPYMRPKFSLLSEVADANRCRAVLSQGHGIAAVFGHPDDLEATEVLFTSLLAQATSAMLAAGRTATRSRTASFRHAFLLAFALRVGERLRAANQAAVDEAEPSVLPVLAARAGSAEAAVAAAFPRLRSMSTSASNAAGLGAGVAAGDRAQLGTARLPDGRSALGRPA